jgi:hypothetical protein
MLHHIFQLWLLPVLSPGEGFQPAFARQDEIIPPSSWWMFCVTAAAPDMLLDVANRYIGTARKLMPQ